MALNEHFLSTESSRQVQKTSFDTRYVYIPNLEMKAIEQYFHVVLFIMLYKVVLTFKSVDKTLVCDHSNENYWAVLSCGTVYYAVQGGSNF